MSESVRGYEVLWKRKKDLSGYLEWFIPYVSKTAYYIKDTVYIDGIVAGDDRKKGISIVAIDSGEELTCIYPGADDIEWEGVKEAIRTGVYDVDKVNKDFFGGVGGFNPHCPYK